MGDITESIEAATVIGNRYLVETPLGRGGMAVVMRVLDRMTGDRVALKQLLVKGPPATVDRARMLFERECRTLALLDHPRIVRFFDYGVDDNVPYYTMELLDGGDLTARAPRPWREVCAIGRDVCSALSLVHARRMVYRDLSPRNVRCTSDGNAKLIDFGAMAPMGSAEFVVCTPAVAAPEVVNLQSLDGRADLYALGAVLYLTLSGRSPYPATSFHMLPQLWGQPIAPPSAHVHDIPEALDSLVMELLKLDPKQRPASASEVSERICAIADLGHDEQLVESQAYLTTPELVGRDKGLKIVQRRLRRLKLDRRGGGLLLRGAQGAGRSRMLDASVSLAKLEGVTILRVGGDDGAGRLEAVYRCAEQLLSSLPDAASFVPDDAWPVLAQLVPSLPKLAPGRPVEFVDAAHVQSAAPSALRAWLLAVTREHPLFIGVDDIERLDVESRNLIALLAERARSHALMVVVARSEDIAMECDALQLLAAKSGAIRVHPLDAREVRALLESVFGDVPHLSALANRLYALAAGNPRQLMQLARHLFDQGVVRHQRGGWTLPENVTEIGLPKSMAEATAAIVDGLRAPARELAQAIALGGIDQRFDLADILRLIASSRGSTRSYARESLAAIASGRPTAYPASLRAASLRAAPIADSAARDGLLADLGALSTASVLVPAAGTYRLAGREWMAPLLASIAPPRAREVHAQLAEIFALRGDGPREAFHLIRAGRDLEGVDALARYAEASCTATDAKPDAYLRFLEDTPDDWRAMYGEALALAVNHPRRKHVEVCWPRARTLASPADTARAAACSSICSRALPHRTTLGSPRATSTGYALAWERSSDCIRRSSAMGHGRNRLRRSRSIPSTRPMHCWCVPWESSGRVTCSHPIAAKTRASCDDSSIGDRKRTKGSACSGVSWATWRVKISRACATAWTKSSGWPAGHSPGNRLRSGHAPSTSGSEAVERPRWRTPTMHCAASSPVATSCGRRRRRHAC